MRDHYFTTDHEWIDFQGAVAFIGVCNYKVSKLKTIEKIVFPKSSGIKKKGDVLAVIYTKNGRIQGHMTVNGKNFKSEKHRNIDRPRKLSPTV